MTTNLLTTVHVNAMVKALRDTRSFTVTEDKDAETVEAVHVHTGKSVLKALCKGGDAWIVTHHPKLFVVAL